MGPYDKPLAWLGDSKEQVISCSMDARKEAGYRLRQLQKGGSLSLPHSRPMPSIGQRCYELRIRDRDAFLRIIYRIDSDAIVIAEVLLKKTNKTPKYIIDICKERLKNYDLISKR